MGVKKETFPWDDAPAYTAPRVTVPHRAPRPVPRDPPRPYKEAPWYCNGQPMPRQPADGDWAGDWS